MSENKVKKIVIYVQRRKLNQRKEKQNNNVNQRNN